jgi:hypothetical protein
MSPLIFLLVAGLLEVVWVSVVGVFETGSGVQERRLWLTWVRG